MTRLLKRNEIDDRKWNQTVLSTKGQVPYAMSWVLDSVSEWEAIVGNEYRWVMPIPYNTKLPFWKQAVQPFFVQQLGIYGDSPFAEERIKLMNILKKRYWRVILQVPEEQAPLFDSFATKKRMNYQLDLNQRYEHIQQNYSKSLRKRIRKNTNKVHFQPTQDWSSLISFYRKEVGEKTALPDTAYKTILELFHSAAEQHAIQGWTGRDHDSGQIVLQAAILQLGNYLINLFGASNELGRAQCAMHVFLDTIIRQNAESNFILDFEGSDIKGIAQFFSSFGSKEQAYLEVSRTLL